MDINYGVDIFADISVGGEGWVNNLENRNVRWALIVNDPESFKNTKLRETCDSAGATSKDSDG